MWILTSVLKDRTAVHQTPGVSIHRAHINATAILDTLPLSPQQLVETLMNVRLEVIPALRMATPIVSTPLARIIVAATAATICLAVAAIVSNFRY